MLKLNVKLEPFWLDLESGVQVFVRPCSTAIVNLAQTKAAREILDIRKRRAEGEPNLPDMDDAEVRSAYIRAYLTEHLGLASIIEWRGVFDPSGTEVVGAKPETIRGLFSIPHISRAFFDKYLATLDGLDIEGNDSGLAARGNSAAGQATAQTAASKTSRAAGKKPTRSAARAAHT